MSKYNSDMMMLNIKELLRQTIKDMDSLERELESAYNEIACLKKQLEDALMENR